MINVSYLSLLSLLLLASSSSVYCVRTQSPEASPFLSTPSSSSAPDQASVSVLRSSRTQSVAAFAPRTYGIRTIQGFSPIIVRGDKLPMSKTMRYTTIRDNQTQCSIEIYEDIRNRPTKIRAFHVKNIPPAPRGREKVDVTFNVNDRGILYATGQIVSTGASEALSIVSSSLNSSVPQRYESEDRSVRLLTPSVLGSWFWEVNTDITTLNQSRAHFETNPLCASLAQTLNTVVERTMPLSSFTSASTGWIDYTARNLAFHRLVDTTVRRIRSSIVQTDLPHGLQDIHFRTFFEGNIPALIEFLNSKLGQPHPQPDTSQTDWHVVSLPQASSSSSAPGPTGSETRPIPYVSSEASKRFRKQTGFTESIYVERIDPDYFMSVGGFTKANPNLRKVVQLLNHFATINGGFYEYHGWGQSQYDSDRMRLTDIIRRQTHCEQRRGGGDPSEDYYELVGILEDCKTETDGYFDSVIKVMIVQFG